MRRRALDLMLAQPWLDMTQLSDLISVSSELTDEDQQTIWSRVQTWSNPADEERAGLREHNQQRLR